MVNKKPKLENGQQKHKMLSFTSQLFLMGTKTSLSRILKNILHQVVSHDHFQHLIFQNLKIFQKTGRKARLQNHCAQVVLHWEMHLMHKVHQGHASQQEITLESQPRSIVTNFTCKDTTANWICDCQLKMLNFELYTHLIVL